MQKEKDHIEELNKTLAAVCGLYCEACSLFIGTNEDPARLLRIAKQFHVSEEAAKCYGCRSTKRGPYCENCKMFSCAAERGIDFCNECAEYPCSDLKQFQSEMPHRIELWDDLEHIKIFGCKHWLESIQNNYSCPQCGCINSTYDSKCRKCGKEPSCEYVARHKETIETYMKHR